MSDRIQLNERVTVGGQPSAQEIQELKTAGFSTVVNLRTEGEDDQPMSPDEERRLVEGAGLTYLHLPVWSQGLRWWTGSASNCRASPARCTFIATGANARALWP